jgi:hypothetical protein
MPPFHILRTRKKTPILAEVWVNCMYATVILINRALRSTVQSCNLNTANKCTCLLSPVSTMSMSGSGSLDCKVPARLHGRSTKKLAATKKSWSHIWIIEKRCNFLLDQRFCKCLDVNGSANENKIFGLVLVLFNFAIMQCFLLNIDHYCVI